jgi:hypothetical protein
MDMHPAAEYPAVVRPLALSFAFVVGASFCALNATLAREARADTPDPGVLFDRGLAEMQAHQFATGCPDLAESYRLEPHAGGLFTLAECEAQWGKIASAIADYDGFLDLLSHLPPPDRVKQAARAKLAAEKRTALAREVPHVTLSLDTNVVAGTTVTLDGKAVPDASLRLALAVDPGDHLATLHLPDGRTTEQHVTVAAGETRAVTLTMTPPPTAATPTGDEPTDTPTEPPAATPASTSSRNTAVFVTGGIGAAALIAGGVLGAIVLSDKSSIDAHCPAGVCDTSSQASSANSAKTLGWISTGAFAAGGAAVVAAVVLRFAWPKAPPASTSTGAASLQPLLSFSGGFSGLSGMGMGTGGVAGIRGAW